MRHKRKINRYISFIMLIVMVINIIPLEGIGIINNGVQKGISKLVDMVQAAPTIGSGANNGSNYWSKANGGASESFVTHEPGIMITLYRDKDTSQLMGMEDVASKGGQGYKSPADYIINHYFKLGAPNKNSMGSAGGRIHVFTKDVYGRGKFRTTNILEATGGIGGLNLNPITNVRHREVVQSNPVGDNGVYYAEMKAKLKENGQISGFDIGSTKAGVSTQVWDYIMTPKGKQPGMTGNRTGGLTYDIMNRAREVFKLKKVEDAGASLSPTDEEEQWLRYLDFLMTLRDYATDTSNPSYADWNAAIHQYVTNHNLRESPVNVVMQGMNYIYSPQGDVILTWIDFLNHYAGIKNQYAIDKIGWRSGDRAANLGIKGSMYNQFATSAGYTIIEDGQSGRISSGGYDKNNPWHNTKTTVTRNQFRTVSQGTSNDHFRTFWGSKGSVNIHSAEIVQVDENASGYGNFSAMYGTLVFLMPTSSPITPLGKLVALPDDYLVPNDGKMVTIPVPVELEFYAGASSSEIAIWEDIATKVENDKGTIEVTIADLNVDVKPSVGGLGSPKYSVGLPLKTVMTPAEFRDWLHDRKPIKFLDNQTNGADVTSFAKDGGGRIVLKYDANVTVAYGVGDNRKSETKPVSDPASFIIDHFAPDVELIRYTSKPEAYAEIKNYGRGIRSGYKPGETKVGDGSDMQGTLVEDWEAMAGVPSTEQLYFAAGGSEFIVDISFVYTEDEFVRRTYRSYFNDIKCEYQDGDICPPKQLGGYTMAVHGGSSQTHTEGSWNGALPWIGDVQWGDHWTSVNNEWDMSPYEAAVEAAQAYADEVNATVLDHTSASDKLNRSHSGWSATVHASYWESPGWADPGQEYIAPTPPDEDGKGGDPGQPYIASSGEQGTDGGYNVYVTFSIPECILCGPCCEHELPRIEDTWAQEFNVDSMRIVDVHVWQIDKASVNGMEEILNVDVVGADMRGRESNGISPNPNSYSNYKPNIFYNIAMKNDNEYDKVVGGKGTFGEGGATGTSQVGRVRYGGVETQQHDVVIYDEARNGYPTRTDRCDGMAHTKGPNVIPAGGKGHQSEWNPTGFIYDTFKGSPSFYGHYRGQRAGNKEYLAADDPAYLDDNTDDEDKTRPEYSRFKEHREKEVLATTVTDFLILQTTNGVQSVLYFDKTADKAVRSDINIPDIEVPQSELWEGNGNSASKWAEDRINVGGYNGNYSGGSGPGPVSSNDFKFKTQNKEDNPLETHFESFNGTDPASESTVYKTATAPSVGGSTIRRPTKPGTEMMLYEGELNIITGDTNKRPEFGSVDQPNKSYTTGKAEVYWGNLLHYIDKITVPQFGTGGITNTSRVPYGEVPALATKTSKSPITGLIYGTGKHEDDPRQNHLGTNRNPADIRNRRFNYTTIKADTHYKDRLSRSRTDPSGLGFAGSGNIMEDGGLQRQGAGYTQEAIYSKSHSKVNDIIIHDPVSTENSFLIALPNKRDQRIQELGRNIDLSGQLDRVNTCPGVPDLCEFRSLTCDHDRDIELLNINFENLRNNNPVDSKTNDELILASGFKIINGEAGMSGNSLHSDDGVRISMPFSGIDFKYRTSEKLSVKANVKLKQNSDYNQMIFSFKSYGVYVPKGKNYLAITTGNGEELRTNAVVTGGRTNVEVIFSMRYADKTVIKVNGVEQTLTKLGTSKEISAGVVGTDLNIGSFGISSGYGIKDGYIDNLEVTRIAGDGGHTDECYIYPNVVHVGGMNYHEHNSSHLNGTRSNSGFYNSGAEWFVEKYGANLNSSEAKQILGSAYAEIKREADMQSNSTNKTYTAEFTGKQQKLRLDPGEYFVEVYGAQWSASGSGSKGDKIEGILNIKSIGEELILEVGGQKRNNPAVGQDYFNGNSSIKINNATMVTAGGDATSNSKLTDTKIITDSKSGNGRIIITEIKSDYKVSVEIIKKHWRDIPADSPIWACNKNSLNSHKCTSACGSGGTPVLDCGEPHHSGLHYDTTNSICWKPCNNDVNHKNHKPTIDVNGKQFTAGNFINIDYPFQVYYPNVGDFSDGEPYGLGSLTSDKGINYVNEMETTKWTKKKRIRFDINVIYKDRLYLAGEWIVLSDYGIYGEYQPGSIFIEDPLIPNMAIEGNKEFDDIHGGYDNIYQTGYWVPTTDYWLRGQPGGSNQTNYEDLPVAGGKHAVQGEGLVGERYAYNEEYWSNYGTDMFDDVNGYAPDGNGGIMRDGGTYQFYAVLSNNEVEDMEITVDVEAINAPNGNDNRHEETNRIRNGAYQALHGGTRRFYTDVVGRIGNLTLQDTTDYRFSNLMKTPIEGDPADKTEIYDKTTLLKQGNVTDDGTTLRVLTVGSAVGLDATLQKGYYKLTVSGNNLSNGELSVKSNAYWKNIGDYSRNDYLNIEIDDHNKRFEGPGILLDKGEYKIVLNGRGLSAANFRILGGNSGDEITPTTESKNDQRLEYYVTLDGVTNNFRIIGDFSSNPNSFGFDNLIVDKLDRNTDADLIANNHVDKIDKNGNMSTYYINIPETADVEIRYNAINSSGFNIATIQLDHLGERVEGWYLDNIVKKVDPGKQNTYLWWVEDIRGYGINEDTWYIDTWGTRLFQASGNKDGWKNEPRNGSVNGKWYSFPLQPEYNNIDILKDEPLLPGYDLLLDITTVGDYYNNEGSLMQVLPYYYGIKVEDFLTKDEVDVYPVDVYMKVESRYEPINIFGNYGEVDDGVVNSKRSQNVPIYNFIVNLDWLEESVRRNYNSVEQMQTDFFRVYYGTGGQNNDKDYEELDPDGGKESTAYKQLDAPLGSQYKQGNPQVLQLDGKARTFIGGEKSYETLPNHYSEEIKNLSLPYSGGEGMANEGQDELTGRYYNSSGGRLRDNNWWSQAQRWHFTLGLPSSTVFVLHDETSYDAERELTQEMLLQLKGQVVPGQETEEGKEDGEDWIILATADIKAVGDTFILQYEHLKMNTPQNALMGDGTSEHGRYEGGDVKYVEDKYLRENAMQATKYNGELTITNKDRPEETVSRPLPTDIPPILAIYTPKINTSYDIGITKTH